MALERPGRIANALRSRVVALTETSGQWRRNRPPSSLSDWSLADRGMERRFALREPATGC